jgi:thiamine biosynthesis lipoprotein ApbE
MQDDEGTFALHALNLSIANTGVAAISRSQFRASPPIDPRTKMKIEPTCKGVVVLMDDAALAQGLAGAAFVLGPVEGMKLIEKHGKGVIVDNAGKFLRTPGF